MLNPYTQRNIENDNGESPKLNICDSLFLETSLCTQRSEIIAWERDKKHQLRRDILLLEEKLDDDVDKPPSLSKILINFSK